jgi:hypothetical protein
MLATMPTTTTSPTGWIPDVFYSGWTWVAIVVAFALGAGIVWIITRKILITGAIAIVMTYLSFPAGRIIVDAFGLDVEVPAQGREAAVVVCVIGALLLLTELVTRYLEYRKSRSIDNLLNHLRELLQGKSRAQKATVIEGLLLSSSKDPSSDDELIQFLDEVEPGTVRSLSSPKKGSSNAAPDKA